MSICNNNAFLQKEKQCSAALTTCCAVFGAEFVWKKAKLEKKCKSVHNSRESLETAGKLWQDTMLKKCQGETAPHISLLGSRAFCVLCEPCMEGVRRNGTH
ncbi:MAG: hypothetical protein ACOX4Z_08725 [Desulfobulbus sp.]